jgi:hypothetical protein
VTGSPRLLAVLLLGAAIVGCGAGHRRAGSASRDPRSADAARGYLNDGDGDHPGDSENDNNHDTDNDPSEDYKPDENGLYHERDDSGVAAYGAAASAVDERAIANLVRRYYAAAAIEDGAQACTMLVVSLARAIPNEYGHSGPSYLRGHKTCAALTTALFKHTQAQMAGEFVVTGIRVSGGQAFALLGSRTVPASYISLQREHGRWRISELVGSPLP